MNEQLNQIVSEINQMSVDIENNNLFAVGNAIEAAETPIAVPMRVQPTRPPVDIIEAPQPIPTAIEVPTHVEPVNPPGETVVKTEQCSLLELSKHIVKEYEVVKEANKIVAKIGRRSIAAAISCGDFANKAKELGKETGEIPHGKWGKWLEELFQNKSAVRSVQKWMTLATFAKEYPNEIGNCTNLSDAEVVCGVRTPPKPIDRDKQPADNNGETTPLPAIILTEIQRSFEHIQQQYDVLTGVDPEVNRFLLGKGYDNDLPLLLQQWQSSLSDALGYFGLEPISNVCVRCGKVRAWDDLFVPISAYYDKQHLQRFNLWCEQCEADYDYDFEKQTFTKEHVIKDLPNAIEELTANLTELKSLPVKEYTLAQKIDQLKTVTVAKPSVITAAESNVWILPDINNVEETLATIERLSPKIVIVKREPKTLEDRATAQLWDIYRHYVSSAVNNQPPTRHIKFLVVDDSQPNKPVLGIGSVSGDAFALRARDEFIGWTKDQKREGKLKHTAVGSTIIATQPFGSNFLGGKLIASLITSQPIRDEWKRRYKNLLAGMTTTSLFGFPSMYDRMKEWKRLGLSTGKVPIQPKLEIYKKWVRFIKDSRLYEYNQMLTQDEGVSGPVNNSKGKTMTMIYKSAGLNPSEFMHGHKRGVYFSEFYENTRDFLCGKIAESELKMKPLFGETVGQITDRWRTKAIKRYKELNQEGKLRPETQSYSQLGQMDFETARQVFLDDDMGSDDIEN